MKDKKIIILSIVGVLLLVSIVVATSYAYFVANVSGNKDTNNVVVTNGVMSLEYKDGDAINLGNAIPGSSVSKTFTVKNTGNVSTNYTIYFSELSNKFVDKTDLVYTLTSSDGGKNVAQTQVPSTNDAMVSNYAIEAGKTHTYTLTITFLNKDENQDDNQGVSFTTKIGINESVEYVEPVEILGKKITDTTQIALDDPDNNIRYIGANPNNYVYFNCNDYSNQSDSTCEKWRIIGVFKNMTKEDGSKEDLVKIIRDDSLGNLVWNNSGSNWSAASLQKTLNGEYYNGTYATGAFKNDSTRNAIESVAWNLGGPSNYDSALASHWYSYKGGRWTGKVGLMNPSDYGYATAGGSATNRAACLAKALFNWSGSDVSDCRDNDYLFKSSYKQWTMASNSYSYVYFVHENGMVSFCFPYYGEAEGYEYFVRPTAFLKSNILISEVGNGSSESPFQLKVGQP